MKKWEYTLVKTHPGGLMGGKSDANELSRSLNELGGEGWELVATYETNSGYGASREVVLLLKREKAKK